MYRQIVQQHQAVPKGPGLDLKELRRWSQDAAPLRTGERLMEESAETTGKPGDKAHGLLPEMWQEACKQGGRLSFRMVSGSMEPLIRVGDRVRVTRAEPSRLRIGDIVAFRDGQNVIVHRIIGTSRANGQLTFRHRGDNGAASGKFAVKNLIGKVCAIEKDEFEIPHDTSRYVLTNKILGWRLRIKDSLGRTQYKHISTSLRLALRPIWQLCRRFLLPHSSGNRKQRRP
jgi:signal peptidase I